ncbi:MAG: tagaturonate reductase [Alicyclobacillus macrosporangiidus]|uniref:tagaturonate reductase n=1 Tax=Alicyclobacillus macrosporangiidus TaxID=392015 RepID=UPI0026EB612A|nr:tagaturonate reductase [Alicyclobacillus macrosporangiidus]MCL6597685.1 tagaturonate reductase [Alicyclobacillus macrosporangiidus]
MLLNRQAVEDGRIPVPEAARRALSYPERVLQVGEGNFLRGFVDWLIHRLNVHGLFKGRVVVAAPRPTGARNVARLNAQDGLYTVWLRGYTDSRLVDDREVVTSVSRAIDPHADWAAFLACAEQRSIEVVVSNTTEAGLRYEAEPYPAAAAPATFPAKLTAYLYRRFQVFAGDPAAGLTVIPCELVDDNGQVLRDLVMRYARAWSLGEAFVEWVETANHFCNTLVDRIVTGFPAELGDAERFAALGYEDRLLTVGEPFHLWAIEADARLRSLWPFERIGLNVRYTDDVTPYRVRKVRILNGAHTSLAPVAMASGLATVREAVEDPDIGQFVHHLVEDELVPAAAAELGDRAEAEAFAMATLERFRNPFIRHELRAIQQHCLAKAKVRLVPAILGHAQAHGEAPPWLSLAWAFLLLDFHPEAAGEAAENDPNAQRALRDTWRAEADVGLQEAVAGLLGLRDVWGVDLNVVPGFTQRVAAAVQSIREHGPRPALRAWMEAHAGGEAK